MTGGSRKTARLSPRMGARAKKAVLAGRPGDTVRGILEISPTADSCALEDRLARLGARVRSWSPTMHHVTVEAPVARLSSLVDLEDVVYFEAESTFSQD